MVEGYSWELLEMQVYAIMLQAWMSESCGCGDVLDGSD
jgi:hypothetical protein